MAPDERRDSDETNGLLKWREWLPLGRLHLGENQVKSLRYLAGLALLGVALLLFNPDGERSSLGGQLEPTTGIASSGPNAANTEETLGRAAGQGHDPSERWAATATQVERELTGILAQIQGVGSVDVEVVLETSGTRTYAMEESKDRSETEEQDGTVDRHVLDESWTRNPVTLRQQDGSEQPLLVSEERPEVAGVLVVAEGAREPATRFALVDAVSTVLNVPEHRVAVYPK